MYMKSDLVKVGYLLNTTFLILNFILGLYFVKLIDFGESFKILGKSQETG